MNWVIKNKFQNTCFLKNCIYNAFQKNAHIMPNVFLIYLCKCLKVGWKDTHQTNNNDYPWERGLSYYGMVKRGFVYFCNGWKFYNKNVI